MPLIHYITAYNDLSRENVMFLQFIYFILHLFLAVQQNMHLFIIIEVKFAMNLQKLAIQIFFYKFLLTNRLKWNILSSMTQQWRCKLMGLQCLLSCLCQKTIWIGELSNGKSTRIIRLYGVQ